jgi:uncharacterized membrane protein
MIYELPPGAYPPPAPVHPPPVWQPYRVGAAFSWAWHKFTKNAAPMIVATLVYIVVLVALGVLNRFLYEAVTSDAVTTRSPGQIDDFAGRFATYITSAGGVVTVLGWIAITVVIAVMESAYFAGMLDVANGRPVTVGCFFRPRSVGNVIVASLIVEVVTWIGFGLCLIGGLIARTLLLFTIVALLDRNLSALRAIDASYRTGKTNFWKSLLTLLVAYVTLAVGILACGVGVLIAIPVTALFLVYTYRRFSGGWVAP